MAISESKTIVRAVVPKAVDETIRRMSRVTGKSRSLVIAELLTEAEPALRRLVGMLEVAKQQQHLFPAGHVAELHAALDQLSGDATEVMDRMQQALQLPLEPPKRGKRRAPSLSVAKRGARTRRRPRTPA